jgi:hypothetical protein
MPKLSKAFYAGVFLLSIGMLAAQFLLTRILSVVFWYHFVFLIISVVMFGLTAGTLLIYFFPKVFTFEKTIEHITQYAVLSGVAIFMSFVSLFYLPAILVSAWHVDMQTVVNLYFPILVIPFTFMGVAFSLILTRFPQAIGRIYGVNLLGSAAGCLVAFFLLNTFSGASIIFILAALFVFSAICFLSNSDPFRKNSFRFLAALTVAFLVGGMINQSTDTVQMIWNKNDFVKPPLYSKWNFFSYICVRRPSFHPFGWGYSPKVWDLPQTTTELMIAIDEGAGTVATKFKKLEDMSYVNMDISTLVYYIRPPRSALVIGSGGGRDVLAAVFNGAQKVVGVEINRDIIDIAYAVGKLERFPQIEIHNDDGRSFVARSRDHYDMVQASLVDSFAAASSGAFALSENSLYTKEAWVTYLKHLTPTGVLTFSRWYHKHPLEIYRVLGLAKSALREIGIRDYRNHILLAKVSQGGGLWPDVGTILVSPTAFTDQEILKLQKVSDDLEFEVALTKNVSIDPVFDQILADPDDEYDIPAVNGNIDTPTDNRPFFFYYSDLKHFFKNVADSAGPKILRAVTAWIIVLGVAFLLIPFLFAPQTKGPERIRFFPTLYFSSIGLAFMFIEIPLIQRLGIFLGHPVYGLTVVLFALLLSCGVGSMYSKTVRSREHFHVLSMVLLGAIILLAFLLPAVIQAAMAAPIPFKILISLLSVSSAGFLMGIPFPHGVGRVSANPNAPLIFYWAVNGFTSMCASAFATILLIHLGFPWAIMTGLAFYALAFWSAEKMA